MVAAGVATITIGCTPSAARRDEAPSVTARDGSRGQVLDHLTPARDSIGSAPSRFSWTPVEGADRYAIGIWNEVDVLVWRDDHVPATSVTLPREVQLEPGTYFWLVSALRDGQQLAESGLSAFVVR